MYYLQSSRRRRLAPVLSHHRAYRSVHGGFNSCYALTGMLRLCIVPFLPYLSERPTHSRIFFVFRTILLRAALFSEVFCHVWSFLLFPVVLGTSVDSALHLLATMASADFCTFSVTFRSRLFLSEHSVQTSPGTTRFFPSIYLPHLPPLVPCSYWTLTWMAVLSQAIAYIRFLFVRPEVCLQLPSDSTSRWTPLPLAVSFPLPGRFRTFTG